MMLSMFAVASMLPKPHPHDGAAIARIPFEPSSKSFGLMIRNRTTKGQTMAEVGEWFFQHVLALVSGNRMTENLRRHRQSEHMSEQSQNCHVMD